MADPKPTGFRYCLCGSTVRASSTPPHLAASIIRSWYELHCGEGHGPATRGQAARARAHQRDVEHAEGLVAEALQDYALTIGPNTRDDLARGMERVHLSGGERQDVAMIATKTLAGAGLLRSRDSGIPDPAVRKAPRLRRSGSPWTLRVHTWAGDTQTPSHTISNDRVREDSEHHRGHLFPGAEFDEFVVGKWLHIEQMGHHTWWMTIGGVTVHVTADRDGRPTQVRVDGPGDYDEPREGCTYELEWTHLDSGDAGQVTT